MLQGSWKLQYTGNSILAQSSSCMNEFVIYCFMIVSSKHMVLDTHAKWTVNICTFETVSRMFIVALPCFAMHDKGI